MILTIPVSIGEIVDKITILEIKSERMTDTDKLLNVRKELAILQQEIAKLGGVSRSIQESFESLKKINQELWDIEDNIRIKEQQKQFDQEFIELARSVYVTNDRRASVKKDINMALGSDLTEEKSYESYS